MNKLLKVTLLAAVMATSGMADAGSPEGLQPTNPCFMPRQPILFMVMPQQPVAPVVNNCDMLKKVAVCGVVGFMACKTLKLGHILHFICRPNFR